MQKRYLPPTRKSIVQDGAVKPFGPHQRATWSGSVHAFHTSSRGASKTRVMASSVSFARPRPFVLVFEGTVIPPSCPRAVEGSSLPSLFALSMFLQVVGQPVEAVSPQDAVACEPAECDAQRSGINLAAAHAPLGFDLEQARILEHAQVSRDGGEGHLVRLSQIADGGIAGGAARAAPPPGRVGQGRGERGQ